MQTAVTPRRDFLRSSINNGINTTSTPNLAAVYKGTPDRHLRLVQIINKRSSQQLFSHHVVRGRDAREENHLSTIRDDNTPAVEEMAYRPSMGGEHGEFEIGDTVDVPGDMYGTVMFIGTVHGRKGTFAGVELSDEFARRGKNNGDVDGISYFTTSVPDSGIFLPLNKATRRIHPTASSSYPLTPPTGSIGRPRMTSANTTPTPALPKFSQSVGIGRAPSPQFRKSRPSLPRPESPVRRIGTPSGRPSLGMPGTKAGISYAPSPTPSKFSQSVRGMREAGDPAKRSGTTPRAGTKVKTAPRSASALGQTGVILGNEESASVGIARTTDKGSLSSISSFGAKLQPAESGANVEEVARLRSQLKERDQQLKDQASSLAEMENSLTEVQSLMGAGSDAGIRPRRESADDRDASQLRAMLREKNEKIAMLTAEFDAHRADFRSTIDTLELASTETERVYEARVQDLLREVQDYQDRSEDVDSVARQLKQLEELVQELEEGLEDARRGEAEARGEVEFLRGEVERGRSELRREREKAAALQPTNGHDEHASDLKEIEQRDDEIRGLKAIIHSLSRDSVSDNGDFQKTPSQRNGRSGLSQDVHEREQNDNKLTELQAALETKMRREEELEREIEHLRLTSSSKHISDQRISGMTIGSNGTVTQDRSSIPDSKAALASWRGRDLAQSAEVHKRNNNLDSMQESDTYSSATDSSALWCEICETGGHDILTCTNMFAIKQDSKEHNRDEFAVKTETLNQSQKTGKDVVMKAFTPKIQNDGFQPHVVQKKSVLDGPVLPTVNLTDQGPVAGRESGIVDNSRWCALCERDGHDSVDCPFEAAF